MMPELPFVHSNSHGPLGQGMSTDFNDSVIQEGYLRNELGDEGARESRGAIGATEAEGGQPCHGIQEVQTRDTEKGEQVRNANSLTHTVSHSSGQAHSIALTIDHNSLLSNSHTLASHGHSLTINQHSLALNSNAFANSGDSLALNNDALTNVHSLTDQSHSTARMDQPLSSRKIHHFTPAQNRHIAALRLSSHRDFDLLVLSVELHEQLRKLCYDKRHRYVRKCDVMYASLCQILSTFYPRLRRLQMTRATAEIQHNLTSKQKFAVDRLAGLMAWLKDFVLDFVDDLTLTRQQRLAVLAKLSTPTSPSTTDSLSNKTDRFMERLPSYLHDLNRPYGMLNLRFLHRYICRPLPTGRPVLIQSLLHEKTDEQEELAEIVARDQNVQLFYENIVTPRFRPVTAAAASQSYSVLFPRTFECLADYLSWKLTFQLVHPSESILPDSQSNADQHQQVSEQQDDDEYEDEDVYMDGFLYQMIDSFNSAIGKQSSHSFQYMRGNGNGMDNDDEEDDVNPFVMLKDEEFKSLVPLYQSVLDHLDKLLTSNGSSQFKSNSNEHSEEEDQSLNSAIQVSSSLSSPFLLQQIKETKITLLRIQEAIILLKLLHPNGYLIHLDSFPFSTSDSKFTKLIERILSCLFSGNYINAIQRKLE